KTIIGTEEKYDRKNEKRRSDRRNEEGLTKREQEKKTLINSIQILKNQGYTQKEISKKIGKSLRTIKNYWNI
ncbi:MAG: DNA-binding response regulator, partial [Peptostreptococcaceae bacterium]